jgi:hypothetical protein
MDNWVNMDGDCPMSYEVIDKETQIEIGHGAGTLHLVLTMAALAQLANLTDRALQEAHR